jgi:uncharacterized caspase-like protein
MTWLRWILALVLAAACGSTAWADAPKKVALVIGNSDYANQAHLKNPANDAKAMATALRGKGFEVIEVENATKSQFERAAGKFGDALTAGATGLFYYAGHGMQVDGRNYLLPIDAKVEREERVRLEAINVDDIISQMTDAKTGVSLVILDACRNNPFERRFRSVGGGLAQMSAPEGTFIAYATAPGSVAADGTGEHGIYSQALLEAMQQPGLKVEDVFKAVRINVSKTTDGVQVPWESSSLTGDFYFTPAAPVAAAANEAELARIAAAKAELERQQAALKDAQAEAAKVAAAKADLERQQAALKQSQQDAAKLAAEKADLERQQAALKDVQAEAANLAAAKADLQRQQSALKDAQAEAAKLAAAKAELERQQAALKQSQQDAAKLAAEKADLERQQAALKDVQAEAAKLAEAKADLERQQAALKLAQASGGSARALGYGDTQGSFATSLPKAGRFGPTDVQINVQGHRVAGYGVIEGYQIPCNAIGTVEQTAIEFNLNCLYTIGNGAGLAGATSFGYNFKGTLAHADDGTLYFRTSYTGDVQGAHLTGTADVRKVADVYGTYVGEIRLLRIGVVRAVMTASDGQIAGFSTEGMPCRINGKVDGTNASFVLSCNGGTAAGTNGTIETSFNGQFVRENGHYVLKSNYTTSDRETGTLVWNVKK